jgi:hypothetical protein
MSAIALSLATVETATTENFATNFLSRNILPATPFDAGIYRDVLAAIRSKPKKGSTLANRCPKKIMRVPS